MNPPIVIRVECAGLAGEPLPLNARVVDKAGHIYEHASGGWRMFPKKKGHSIVVPFLSLPPCPKSLPTEVAIYEAAPGWDFAKLLGADWLSETRPPGKLILPNRQREYPGDRAPEVSEAAMSIINRGGQILLPFSAGDSTIVFESRWKLAEWIDEIIAVGKLSIEPHEVFEDRQSRLVVINEGSVKKNLNPPPATRRPPPPCSQNAPKR